MNESSIPLKKLCLSISDGDHMPPPKAKSGIPFITISNIQGNVISFENCMFVPHEYWEHLEEKRKPQIGDVLLSVTGSYGIPVYIDSSKEFVFQRHIAIIRPNPELLDGVFLYQYLKTPFMRKLMDINVTGAIQKTLGLSAIGNLPFPNISVDEQKKRSHILQLIDEKIRLNNSICNDIERVANYIYQYWFAQFDFPDENGKPYKSSGGKMVWNGELKQKIPCDWRVGTLSDVGTIVGGATPSTKVDGNYTPNGIGWITPYDLSGTTDKYIAHGERDITDSGLASCSASLMPAGTVLMTSRAPIGYLAVASKPLCTNQGFKSIVPGKAYGTEFIYHTLKTMMPYIKKIGVGSTFAEVSKDTLSGVKVVLPDTKTAQKFEIAVSVLCQKRKNCEEENRELTSLRDFLLPMLMNGQVKIK